MSIEKEKQIQENVLWERSSSSEYSRILGHFQAESCIEHGRGPMVLDLPCGDGMLTEIFTRHFDRVVGVDASARHLEVARVRAPKAEFHESLIEDLDLGGGGNAVELSIGGGGVFNTVFMVNILEHVLDPVGCLQKAASFLDKDGILIAHVPNALAVNRKIAVLMGTLESCEELSPFDIQIAGHRRSYTMETLTNDIELAGLEIVKTGGIFYKMLSTPQMDWFLKNGQWEGNNFGWGRVGGPEKNWKNEFCRACYEIGRERPEDCNVIFACATR